MHLNPSDPDIATLLTRIRNGDLELQPDFQRGEVWSYGKKQKLIDSVLRGWHIPPIHVIEAKESARQEVLDGQQRLVAIRDFANGKVRIDGRAEPLDEQILPLHDKTYSDLPDLFRRRFDQFTIRVMRVTDFKPAEPAELFFRLNQPVGLTTAEQRNAFFGETRHQIRELVSVMEEIGVNKDIIGFSNSRMAYDDIVARVAMTLDNQTLGQKIDAGKLANQYRADRPFSPENLKRIEKAIYVFSGLRSSQEAKVKFNKATLYSWLLFVIRAHNDFEQVFDGDALSKFLSQFEMSRLGLAAVDREFLRFSDVANDLITVYEDRSTSRVGDVLSVILRDLIMWIMFLVIDFPSKPRARTNSRVALLHDVLRGTPLPEENGMVSCQNWLSIVIQKTEWGQI
jgi:hypothetical protein